jgi:TusE/DsrC/DsvC family sulfur relay protein
MADSMREILNPGLRKDADPDFPQAPQDWSQADAEQQARSMGLDTGPDHWEAVRALQEYFARHEEANVREIHDALDERFHSRGGMKYLYKLFPGGPVAQGCRLAGLEAPAGAVDTSFGSVQ